MLTIILSILERNCKHIIDFVPSLNNTRIHRRYVGFPTGVRHVRAYRRKIRPDIKKKPLQTSHV